MVDHRRVTMKDIANSLGVSVSTVSLALRDDPRISISVKRRVQAEAKKLGYRISLSGALLSQSKPKIIGVVANFEQELHSAYVKEMQSLASQNGYWMMAENASSYKNPIDALKKLSQFRVETIIAIDPPISLYSNDLKPTVVIAQGCDSPTASLVISDSFQGARDLADHLYSLGHRYVVYLDGPKGVSADARRKVIRLAMEQKDISLKIWQAGNSLEAGFEATQELLTEVWSGKERLTCKSFGERRGVLGRTTAIVCYNDQCAEGAYIALLKAGISVPRDVSLVGFDNSEIGAGKAFRLTTIDRNRNEVAILAFELACAQQEGKLGKSITKSVPSRLIIRESTACANYLAVN
ncbi:LacI family DNA-binding transcriptional regulator [Varibaculum massiliense]|uniref:LacI family DNA-binding transcriptional regulator n=1 Tax=Varibaculum massiliense TaxID=1852372 RepID=UPI0008D9C14F|nr:LacI family DNA-binding transcriptional regulator [Varibaculum massiliense]